MLIRDLQPSEVALVEAFYDEAQDYWRLADRQPPGPRKAAEFFTDGPPGCDPAQSHRLGLFVGGRLSGVAELSFGFPAAEDAYLGLMLLAPRLRGGGHGAALLREVERLARLRASPRLLLGVLEENPRGRAFWEREGFRPTGICRRDDETGHVIHRLEKGL